MLHWISQTISSFKTAKLLAKAPKSISPRYSRFASRNPQQGPVTRPLGSFFVRFLSYKYIPIPSACRSQGEPTQAFLQMIRIASPLKKKHRPRKKVQQKDLLTKVRPSPRTTCSPPVSRCHFLPPTTKKGGSCATRHPRFLFLDSFSMLAFDAGRPATKKQRKHRTCRGSMGNVKICLGFFKASVLKA